MKKLECILCVIVACFAFACQQLPDDDAWMSGGEEKTLKVKVRSAEEKEIVYPLYLYGFTDKGKLVASQTIADSEGGMSLVLSQGDFQIVAVSGVSDAYQMPEVTDLDDVIELTGTEGAETSLMVGRANVEIGDAKEASVQITLTNVVASLSVKLKDVPENVSEVQLALSPLHSHLSLGGDYGGDSQKVKVKCTLDSDGVWASDTTYIFPGNGKETIFSICFKTDDGTEMTYGHTFQGVPEANHIFNVVGTYSGGVIVGGSFDVEDWEGTIDVEFEFGANVVPDDEEGKDDEVKDPEVNLEGVPEVGTIWNGMIVADMGEADETGVDVLLLTLDEWEATTSQVEDVLENYSVNGISDWRLPTHDEAALLRARFSGDNRTDLNDLIAEYDSSLYGLDGEARYMCTKNDLYYSFKFAIGTTTTKAGDKRSYYVRLVKVYRMTLE